MRSLRRAGGRAGILRGSAWWLALRGGWRPAAVAGWRLAVGGAWRLAMGGAALLAATAGGCLYMPPPPGAIAPLPDGDTSISLHVSADLLPLAQGRSAAGSVGFFPTLRYGISDVGEVVFSPWPAYRHWVCLDGDARAYHQISLGGFHPVSARGSQVGQYLRYDFRVVSPIEDEGWSCQARSPESEPTATLVGFWLAARGGVFGRNVVDVTAGASGGLGSERYGVVIDPGILTILEDGPRGRLDSRWFRELRAGVWAGR